MRKTRTIGVAVAMMAAAALPLTSIGAAGAQDAGDCGEGGVAAAAEQTNTGGLIGALVPVEIQAVVPINLPVLSPSAESCNTNTNTSSSSSGGGTVVVKGAGGHTGGAVPVQVGGATPALAVGGAPTFAG